MGDETYNRKLESLQQYIPFLDNMITQLKDPSKKNREQQLNKMQSLHAMITDKRKKLKLETLVKCEDVISKLYEKVHNKPITPKNVDNFFMATPASPSPPREISPSAPLTIPMERLEENRIPKIDIYSSAGESLNRQRIQQNASLGTKIPDMSKPPISLEDLKTLEDDVQEKINEASLHKASLHELNTLREKLTEQIQMEECNSSLDKKDDLESINTTVRNNLTLTKKVIQPPEKLKVKEFAKLSPSKSHESSPNAATLRKEYKNPSPPIAKSPKILKEPPSIFGSILSNIDGQILGGKKKKEERRSSLTGREEKKPEKDSKKRDRKHSVTKEDGGGEKKDKDAKKKERRSISTEEKNSVKDAKKKDRHHQSDKSKPKDEKNESNSNEGLKKDDKSKHSSKSNTSFVSLTGKTSFEAEEERLKKELELKQKVVEAPTIADEKTAESKDDTSKDVEKICVKKELVDTKPVIGESKDEEPPKQTTFKRLADKYNPKPKKPAADTDVDKEVSEIIEEKMKTSPPKLPVINQIPAPVPPPPSLLICSQMEPEIPQPAPPTLPVVLQNILTPSTTELINTVVSQLRQNNAETENRKAAAAAAAAAPAPVPAPIHAPSVDDFVSDYAREEFTREDPSREDFVPNNIHISDFNNFAPQSSPQQARRDRLNFEPPTAVLANQFNQVAHQNQRFMSPPIMGEAFNENFTPTRSFTPMPQAYPQGYNNFPLNQTAPTDIQPLDYYPPNAPAPANQYSSGPPLLSPEIPHFHNEQKPGNFGMMPNHDPFVHNEDLRWGQDESRFRWDRREQDHRFSRDPRTYREYREMRDSRDPRVMNRDSRDPRDNPRGIRDPRVNREVRENRDPRDRDPRLNKERESRDFDRDRSRFQNRDARPGRYESKFDRVYARTNRDRSSSGSSSSRSYSKDTFTSPLDSLYSGKEEHKTGKGYGVQNFRIPKIKKEDEEKEQSTKVSSTNEDVADSVQAIDDDSNDNDSTNNEVTGNDVDAEVGVGENTEQKDEPTKEIEDIVHETKEKASETEPKITSEEGKEGEVDKTDQEPPKLQMETDEANSVEAPKPAISTPVEQEQAKPADQTILAQFFANLLGSQNKKEKKTALYSLISTFSDSFNEKELSKITKIIKADEDPDSSEEEEEIKKPEPQPDIEAAKEPEKETETEEAQPDDSPVKATKRQSRRRIRRISSTTSTKDEKEKEEDVHKSPEPPETSSIEEENVVVSVGERIKSRKRTSVTPSKPKKKCKTELDMLHEDIQDMFIRDGVLTASGKRMCRILKSDPNALTTPQEPPLVESPKLRKRPGPKPKQKLNTPLSEMKAVKSIRVLIPKMPDINLEHKEETLRRSRRSATKHVYAESDDDDSSAPDNDSVLEEGSFKGDDSDAESTDTEKDKSQTADGGNKTKAVKRRRGKAWASGNIPSNKKKKKKNASPDESTEKADSKELSSSQSDADKSFVVPDRNIYIDFITHKSHECKLCDYRGRFITTHYKTQHPESEILTSRFSPAVAQEAIEDSNKNLSKYENLMRVSSGKFHFTCRFCAFNTSVPPTIFYDHITTHTGEYRHICPMCGDFSASSGKTLKAHMCNVHNNADKRVARKSYRQTVVFGYMCGECNYIQLSEKHVEDHINIFHLEKPNVYKVNLSTTLDPEVVNLAEKEPNAVEETTQEPVKRKKDQTDTPEKPMQPPQPKKRQKAAPKSVKERLKAKKALAEKEDVSDASSAAESESSCSTEPEKTDTSTPERQKPSSVPKRRLTKEISAVLQEEILSSRSRRAAKDKAAEKLKTLMELTEGGARKKSLSGGGDDDKDKNKKAVTEDKNKTEDTEDKNKKAVAEAKATNERAEAVEDTIDKATKTDQKLIPEKREEKVVIKKEVEPNVFTCKTDILEENKKIEQERLQLMDELNKTVGNRTSLNFVDKLCDRLSNNDIMVKQEPRDDLTDSLFPSEATDAPLVMPVLEKNHPTHVGEAAALAKSQLPPTPPPKKPVLAAEDMQVANSSSYGVIHKNNKVMSDMIQKLKGMVANIAEEKSESSMTVEDMDYDSEGPPPMIHVNKLPNVKPADDSTKTMLIGGLMKVIKYPTHLVFSCLVPPCLFSTDNKEAFQKHCSEGHKLSQEDKLTLCDMCGMEMASTSGHTFLESVFKHALEEHADFMSNEPKRDAAPEEEAGSVKPPRQLRLRKLSGDALSIIKKDWEEEIDKTQDKEVETIELDRGVDAVSEVTVNDTITAEELPASTAELEMSDENPFPFKIAGVMSLAEPLPPLTPIAKPVIQMTSSTQLIVKEAKLSPAEVGRPKKTQKAMAKFIASVSDLYKCPHYYCLFSTNFRDFLEKHLKAHKVEQNEMIVCMYCDMKTPWAHVPMHIDIRHAHCRFACSYCLYRAVLKEYVFLHQDQVHPESHYSVIALPQPKHSKRWAIADVKIDPKTLCEPYRCTLACDVEFLFENEFKKHLVDVHKSNFISCGYKNCPHMVQSNKMPNHWSSTHSVSVYQCGHCKVNSNDIKAMYKHFAMFHQGLVLDILIRKLIRIPQEGALLGYSAEAFAHLRKIVSMPSNIFGDNKGEVPDVESATVPVHTGGSVATYGIPTKATLQAVPGVAQKGVIIPGNKALVNRAITLLKTTSPTGSPNLILLPGTASCSTASSVAMSPLVDAQVPSTSATPDATAVPATREVAADLPDGGPNEGAAEKDAAVVPLEHITVSEDNSQGNEEADACEADPLSLDADVELNDASKSAAESSGDESDKLDKSKKEEKNGLTGYQLYRCAFCDISFSNSVDFKRHATYSANCRAEAQAAKPFVCVHCGKKLRNPHVLVEHVQCHGVLRITCSLCGSKFPTIPQTRNHIKNRHNITHTSLTPLNPAKQNPDMDEYVVRPKLLLQMGAGRDAALAEPFASGSGAENVYTPETIDRLPMRHILSSSVKCGLCSYTTKVRTNMVRHLQFHSEEKAVSDTAPVNPVPCLEKNEKMFDKMVNLASSSHTSSRMGGAKPDAKEKEVENHPEYVPSHCRYVCCAHGCSYMCPEEGNLRHHLIALHDGDTSFTCVHCKADLTPTDADNLLKHFKVHGLQLHKCQYCPFVHNLKHKVERHVSDCHLDAPVKVVTLRYMEAEPKDPAQEPSTSGAQSAAAAGPLARYYKPWRCCMCKYKNATREGIENHVLEKHEVDSPFKCAICAYKTNDLDTFPEHFRSVHDNQTVDIIYAYRKMEDDKEKEKESEAFDTTPLWQRDRPRVRHIRGILFDDATPTPPTKSPKKVKTLAPAPATPGPSGVRPAAVAAITSPAPPKGSNLDQSIEAVANGTAVTLMDKAPPGGVTDEFFQTVNKIMRESNEDIARAKDSMVIVIDDEEEDEEPPPPPPTPPQAKNKDNKNAPVAKNRAAKRKGAEAAPAAASKMPKIAEIIDVEGEADWEGEEPDERSLKAQFGPLGAPLWKQFKCPVCNLFKSKRICDFVFHLYKEMKVFRFKCSVCADESITYRYMEKHVTDHHPGENFQNCIVPLSPNERLQAWLQMVIKDQSSFILQNYSKTPPAVAFTGPELIQCEFCPSKYRTEQEKNEHCVSHWIKRPYRCSSCTFTSFGPTCVHNHFKACHRSDVLADEDAMVTTNGPTVAALLKMSDDQHEQEALARPRPDAPVAEKEDKEAAEDQAPAAAPTEEDPAPAASAEDDAALSDSDLIIVTKTDTNVPTEDDIFCCEYCPFMASSEVLVISHISARHDHMHINFKKINRVTCEDPKEHVGCTYCSEIGSEVRIRQHQTEKHRGQSLNLYRYQCSLCKRQKRFLKFVGMKVHFNRLHPGAAMRYTSIYGTDSSGVAPVELKTYSCPLCSYQRNFKPNAVHNMRQHLKQHFKAFSCGLCKSTKYKTRADAISHFAKEHPTETDIKIDTDRELMDAYNTTMAGILASATNATPARPVARNTARKSTSASQSGGATREYSFYGGKPEEVDLSKIMTSVEVNGMHLNMTAERLSKIFDLNVVVAVEDCNLPVNLSSVFDS